MVQKFWSIIIMVGGMQTDMVLETDLVGAHLDPEAAMYAWACMRPESLHSDTLTIPHLFIVLLPMGQALTHKNPCSHTYSNHHCDYRSWVRWHCNLEIISTEQISILHFICGVIITEVLYQSRTESINYTTALLKKLITCFVSCCVHGCNASVLV